MTKGSGWIAPSYEQRFNIIGSYSPSHNYARQNEDSLSIIACDPDPVRLLHVCRAT